MSDSGMDEQTQAEQLSAIDDDTDEELLGEFPPDRLRGAEAYGAGGTETTESVEARAAREQPERLRPRDETSAGLSDPDDAYGEDETSELVADRVDEPDRPSAEEQAMHAFDAEDGASHGLDPDGPDDDGYLSGD